MAAKKSNEGFLNKLVKNILKTVEQQTQSKTQMWLGPPEKNPFVTPTPKPMVKSPAPKNVLGANTNSYTNEQIIRAIQNPPPEYKDLPVATMAAMIVNESQKYPIFKKYPFLPVAQSILESSGMKAFQTKPNIVNKPKQALGWGIYAQDYNPSMVEEVFKDYISALGGRNQETERKYPEPTRKARISTSMTYEPFRKTGDLGILSNMYAPQSDNPEHGGDVYAQRLKYIMDKYANRINNNFSNQ